MPAKNQDRAAVLPAFMSGDEWRRDCMKWRGKVLTGRFGHWCYGYDELPVDETCPEWPCECADDLRAERGT